jgi:hypothetical protein
MAERLAANLFLAHDQSDASLQACVAMAYPQTDQGGVPYASHAERGIYRYFSIGEHVHDLHAGRCWEVQVAFEAPQSKSSCCINTLQYML